MIPEAVLDLCFYRLPSVGFLRDFGENVFQQQFPTFIARFRQGPQNGFDKQGFCPVLIRPTQRPKMASEIIFPWRYSMAEENHFCYNCFQEKSKEEGSCCGFGLGENKRNSRCLCGPGRS